MKKSILKISYLQYMGLSNNNKQQLKTYCTYYKPLQQWEVRATTTPEQQQQLQNICDSLGVEIKEEETRQTTKSFESKKLNAVKAQNNIINSLQDKSKKLEEQATTEESKNLDHSPYITSKVCYLRRVASDLQEKADYIKRNGANAQLHDQNYLINRIKEVQHSINSINKNIDTCTKKINYLQNLEFASDHLKQIQALKDCIIKYNNKLLELNNKLDFLNECIKKINDHAQNKNISLWTENTFKIKCIDWHEFKYFAVFKDDINTNFNDVSDMWYTAKTEKQCQKWINQIIEIRNNKDFTNPKHLNLIKSNCNYRRYYKGLGL